MASSSSSLIRNCKYRVFVSFHGQDVRTTFLSHLRKQLNDDGITMYNDQEMERGETIGPELKKGISESRISMVVLSKNYASSSWCLDELLEILKCKDDLGQIVMTVFYEVDPSHVRNKTGYFGISFNETCARKKDEEKRKEWSKALEYVGNIAGEHSQKWDNESKMIEKISRDVSNKLNATISWDFEDMVGIETHLQKMQSLLHLDKEGHKVMIVGICGPAGIGKTTIARAFHSRFSCSFRLTYFMENLREIYHSGHDEYGSKLCLQKELLSNILNQDGTKVANLGAIRERLYDQKVLIILDDVDDLNQLEALADQTNWFGRGSRIIVTTEDRELLEKHDINNTYHVTFPTEEEARKIFCRYAFRKSLKPEGFEKLIGRVTKICSKLPLGLRVMGSYLCKKTKDDWEDILQGLENNLAPVERDIDRVLRVGYDSLHEEDQLLFLLIAVFFNNKDKGHVKDMVAENNSSVRLGLKTLENKSLIQISIEGNIVMHKLLQQVGRKVIQRQGPVQRQILIDTKDILKFLEKESDNTSVMGISLDISTIPNGVYINARGFKNIRNLQFLRIYNTRFDTNARVHVSEDIEFPHRLRLLHWDKYPGKCLPRTFTLEFLVELNFQRNKLEKLWEGIQRLPNLKKMDLSESGDLKELPDLSKVENLEMLDLNNCWSLVELPPSIANLQKLERLDIEYCMGLQVVPTNLNLASLHQVLMSGCWQWSCIPDIARNSTDLTISEAMLEKVPDSVVGFCQLKKLSIFGDEDKKEIEIEKIPDWIKDLHQLEYLFINNCPKLASIPELPASLTRLIVDNCESLETLVNPFPVDSLIALLYLPNCFKLDREARRVITQQHPLVHSCLPGRTIPEEFNHRALGNSLTIRSDFNLFQVCVVVSPNQLIHEFDIQILDISQLCDIHINGRPIEKNISQFVYNTQTEHLYMSYVSFSDEDDGWLEQDNEILFQFSTTDHKFDIIQCGVRTLSSYESSSQELSSEDESLSDDSYEFYEPEMVCLSQ